MKSSHLPLLALALAAALPTAAQAQEIDDYARVVSVTPQMERYNRPVRECRTEYVQQVYQQPAQRAGGGSGGAVLGAIAGGIIGNQIGGGSGRAAATAAGVIGGAVAGDRIQNRDARVYPGQAIVTEQPVEQCRMVDQWESRPNGYAVTYEYAGRTYTSVLPYDPGRRLRVAVAVTPVLGERR